jgi:hypothetical protein
VPAFTAVYGLVGYAIFLTGAMLEILGHNAGMALSLPCGLFEIAFGALLIAQGFPASSWQWRTTHIPGLRLTP